ncbi:MAG: hypothetical protein U0Y10_24085 [Spirosomataceae bacterium]
MKKRLISWAGILLSLAACQATKYGTFVQLPDLLKGQITGTQFIEKVKNLSARQQDSLIVRTILRGNIPDFLRKFVKVETSIQDTSGRAIKAFYYVSPDYLAIGTDADWVRMPMTPQAAQAIADSLGCFLPTRKISNDIFKAARVYLEPQPLTKDRENPLTFLEHHQLIEKQRNGQRGLIVGIKKDVVLSSQISKSAKPNRVAIYGWHYPSGKPIQPLYVGHVDWYVDYSHGIRLVYHQIWVDKKPLSYQEVLADSVLRPLLCDEADCSFWRYGKGAEKQ